MDRILFKMPFYWLEIWKVLTDDEVGRIFRILCVYAETKIVEYPCDFRDEAIKALDKCLDDIRYQAYHPRSWKCPENVREIRNCEEYRKWRSDVYERDGYRCQNCGKIGGRLNAHHIKSFARHPELRFDINNGITLCENCHKLAHERGFKYAE